MVPDLAPPTLVQDAQGLQRLLADLERQSEIAVDTEADSLLQLPREGLPGADHRGGPRLPRRSAGAASTSLPLGTPAGRPRQGQGLPRRRVRHPDPQARLRLRVRLLFDTRVAASALGEANPGLALGAQGALRPRARQVAAALRLERAAAVRAPGALRPARHALPGRADAPPEGRARARRAHAGAGERVPAPRAARPGRGRIRPRRLRAHQGRAHARQAGPPEPARAVRPAQRAGQRRRPAALQGALQPGPGRARAPARRRTPRDVARIPGLSSRVARRHAEDVARGARSRARAGPAAQRSAGPRRDGSPPWTSWSTSCTSASSPGARSARRRTASTPRWCSTATCWRAWRSRSRATSPA